MKTELYTKNIGYEAEGSFRRHDLFAMFFVYPRNNRPYILSGSKKKVLQKILEYEKKGLQAVVWPLTCISSHGRKTKMSGQAMVVGLNREYKCTIVKADRFTRKDFYSHYNGVNPQHHYFLFVTKPDVDINGNNINVPIYVKSFKRQPRCWPRCLEQFMPSTPAPTPSTSK